MATPVEASMIMAVIMVIVFFTAIIAHMIDSRQKREDRAFDLNVMDREIKMKERDMVHDAFKKGHYIPNKNNYALGSDSDEDNMQWM